MPMNPMDAERLAAIIKAMGHPARLRILERVAKGDPCVSRLEETLGYRQANVSQHLGVLRDRGLVVAQRRGNRTCYHLADSRISDIIRLAAEVFTKRAHRGAGI
jgi:DNA-binding transcriptional ArsR family regulator